MIEIGRGTWNGGGDWGDVPLSSRLHGVTRDVYDEHVAEHVHHA